jgi:hypothetical protein
VNKNSTKVADMPAGVDPSRIVKTHASDLLRDLDLTDDELRYLLDLAAAVKRSPGDYAQALAGKSIALLFEKPSLRTRLTFELAIKQLGGDSLFFEAPIGVREPLKDVARNLDRWVNGIVARVFRQETIDGLAEWSSVPVINALSDLFHPCQALADMQTIRERFGELQGLKLAFIGDGNNVAHSLMLSALRLGMDFSLGCLAEPGHRGAGRRVGRGFGRGALDCARPGRGGTRRAHRLHRRVGQHGPGTGERHTPQGFSRIPGGRRAFRAGAAGRGLHALPARQARRRGERLGDGVRALGGFRSGGESPACAESAAVDDVVKEEGRACPTPTVKCTPQQAYEQT